MLWDPLMKKLMQRVILYAVGINNMQRKRLNSGYLYPLRLYVIFVAESVQTPNFMEMNRRPASL